MPRLTLDKIFFMCYGIRVTRGVRYFVIDEGSGPFSAKFD